MSQRTFVLIKPDAVRRGLVGAVLSRFEAKGLGIVADQPAEEVVGPDSGAAGSRAASKAA